jgi:general secretion pathway protein G
MKAKFPHARKGFTLVELLIVVAIIAIISGIAIPRLLRAYYQAKDKRVMSVMRNFAIAIGIYRIDNEMVPNTTDLEELVDILTEYQGEDILQLTIRDIWGHDFYYRRVSYDQYTLKSFGRDGAEGKPASTDGFDPDADIILISGVFVWSHEGTTVIVGK